MTSPSNDFAQSAKSSYADDLIETRYKPVRPIWPSVDRLRNHVTLLASPEFEGRGTPVGRQKTVDYLLNEFEKLNLQPLFPENRYIQDVLGPKGKDGIPITLGRNLAGLVRGTDESMRDEYVIISAHHDHLGIRNGKIYPGADDNAGSVAMLLEIARHVSKPGNAPKCNLVFLSCDLEENLLFGSRWFVSHPPFALEKIRLFVTSELIGRTLGDLPLPTVFVLGGEHAVGLRGIVDRVQPPSGLRVSHLGVDLVGVRSDYGPFKAEKVPFLFFSGGEHRDYHQPTDTAEKLDYERISQITQVVYGVVEQVANTPKRPTWRDIPEQSLDEVRTISEITGLLLELDLQMTERGKPQLTPDQRFTLSNIDARIREILSKGEYQPGDRPWLVRSAQWMLITLF